MRIALLTYDYTELDSPLSENEVKCDPRPFVPEAEWVEIELAKETAVHTILGFPRDRYDLFFNFCDGSFDSDAPGIDVVRALERLDVPFTGADSRFFDPSREAMKRVCAAWGIDTPGYVIAETERDVERAADTLRFPLIVKHPASYSSVGLTRRSRVEDARALRDQAAITMGLYGAALIEEFIDGELHRLLQIGNLHLAVELADVVWAHDQPELPLGSSRELTLARKSTFGSWEGPYRLTNDDRDDWGAQLALTPGNQLLSVGRTRTRTPSRPSISAMISLVPSVDPSSMMRISRSSPSRGTA